MGDEAHALQDLHAQAEEKAREIVGLQQQRDQLLPWSLDLDDLHTTFRGHASSIEAAERKVAAKNNTVNATNLQKVYQSYMKSLKQFQKVCPWHTEKFALFQPGLLRVAGVTHRLHLSEIQIHSQVHTVRNYQTTFLNCGC